MCRRGIPGTTSRGTSLIRNSLSLGTMHGCESPRHLPRVDSPRTVDSKLQPSESMPSRPHASCPEGFGVHSLTKPLSLALSHSRTHRLGQTCSWWGPRSSRPRAGRLSIKGESLLSAPPSKIARLRLEALEKSQDETSINSNFWAGPRVAAGCEKQREREIRERQRQTSERHATDSRRVTARQTPTALRGKDACKGKVDALRAILQGYLARTTIWPEA